MVEAPTKCPLDAFLPLRSPRAGSGVGADGTADQIRDGSRLRHINGMATLFLDNSRTSPLRHRALGRRGDHPVFSRDEVPAWLVPPRRLADRAAQGFNAPRDLRIGHERGLFGTHVRRERLVESPTS